MSKTKSDVKALSLPNVICGSSGGTAVHTWHISIRSLAFWGRILQKYRNKNTYKHLYNTYSLYAQVVWWLIDQFIGHCVYQIPTLPYYEMPVNILLGHLTLPYFQMFVLVGTGNDDKVLEI